MTAAVLRLTACAVALLCLPARAATVRVDVEGAEPGSSVYVALCQGGLSEEACGRGQEVPAREVSTVTFDGVAAGTYAVAAFQDTNGNGRLDRTALGLPTEPYGFSGATGRRGRPDFAQAAFGLREPGTALRIRLSRALTRR